MDCSLPCSSVHGILQARILEWVTISFSRGSSQCKDQTWVFPHYRQILYCLNHQESPIQWLLGHYFSPMSCSFSRLHQGVIRKGMRQVKILQSSLFLLIFANLKKIKTIKIHASLCIMSIVLKNLFWQFSPVLSLFYVGQNYYRSHCVSACVPSLFSRV